MSEVSVHIGTEVKIAAMTTPKTITVLGSSAGLDDELEAWLIEQSRAVNAAPGLIAVAVLRDYMRACEALRDEEVRKRSKLN